MGTQGMPVTRLLIIHLVGVATVTDIYDNPDVRRSLEQLCTGVDICNPDHSDSRLEFNEADQDGFGSCCHGCSCHKDCQRSLNCCYPKDWLTPDDITSTHHNEDQLDNDNITSTHHNESQLDNGDITSTHHNEDQQDQGTTYQPAKQCMPMQVGIPREDMLPEFAVSSYRTVTGPPDGGCKGNTVCTGLSGQNIQPTCDSSNVAPWGDLLPVHSTKTGHIYKNEMCACCHGVTRPEHWIPILICGTLDIEKERLVTITEHFSFLLNSNKMSANCFITFDHSDDLTLFHNRCFLETIATCPPLAYESFRIPDGMNLSRAQIITACHNGPYVPIENKYTYKNIFCLYCNRHVNLIHLRCRVTNRIAVYRTPGKHIVTYLIYPKSIATVASKQRESPPLACLRNSHGWIEESCRVIECPSGQIRNTYGICVHLQRQSSRQSDVLIKLTYTNKAQVPILTTLNETDALMVKNAFRKSMPWSEDWHINEIYHTVSGSRSHPLVAVRLSTDIFGTQSSSGLTASLRRGWTVELNGHSVLFEQSFLEYGLLRSGVGGLFQPYWVLHQDLSADINSSRSSSNIDNTYWRRIVHKTFHPTLPLLNKLTACNNVALLGDEYEKLVKGILMNKLTNKTMYDMEFKYVDDGNGILAPVVCLNDTPLRRYVNNTGVTNSNLLVLTPSLVAWFWLH